MRACLTLPIIVVIFITGCEKIENEQQHKVGNIPVPPGVVMRSYSTSEPNYQTGDCIVTITALPESKMEVIRYIWIEDFQSGLKPTVDKLEVLPAVVFDDVAESDVKRIMLNLEQLGCLAQYAPGKQGE